MKCRIISIAIMGVIVLSGLPQGTRVMARELQQANNLDPYFKRKEEGWFWKERMPEEPEEQKPEPVPAPTPMTPTLTPAWLRENLPKLLDRALEEPTTENVRDYFYAQRQMLDMSERFAQVAQRVSLTDPLLDENNRRPFAAFGVDVLSAEVNKKKEAVVAKIAEQAGLWYFFRSDCPYCKAQNKPLQRLANSLGMVVLPISLDGPGMPDGVFPHFVRDQGQAQMLDVTTSPSIFMVRPPDQFVLLTEGLVSEDGFIDRMIAGAYEAGWITQDDWEATRPVKPLVPLDQDNDVLRRLVNLVNDATALK